MNMKSGQKYIRIGLTIFITACAIIIFYYVVNHFSIVAEHFAKLCDILTPVFIGLIIAYLLSPVVNFLENNFIYRFFSEKQIFHGATGEKKGKIKKRIRALTILSTYIIFFLLLYGFFNMLIPELISSVQNIGLRLPEYFQNLRVTVDQFLVKFPKIEESVNNALTISTASIEDVIVNTISSSDQNEQLAFLSTTGGVVKGVISSGMSFLKMMLNVLVGLMISIYLINSKELLIGQCKKMLYAVLKRDTANTFIHNCRFAHKTFLGFFMGKIIDSMIIGVICFFLTKIIGTPYGTLISVVVGVTNIIPYFGPFIGAIPSAVLVLLVDPKQCLYFVIMIVLLQQFDGNILGPKILGESTGLSSLWVIIAITLFGGLLGFAGMVIGVPLFAVIYTSISSYVNTRLTKKMLTTDTKKYVHVDLIDEDDHFKRLPKESVQRILNGDDFKHLATRHRQKNTLETVPENENDQKSPKDTE
ncbi:MAG: AI-2E family transporter [Lachnospiraceae bacterium]|nr:AI-2E family transporter [Lachnospiraceae bacterium]